MTHAYNERARDQRAAVTVIIPCYNNETTIGRAIQSVADQTWRPKEVIVVDDCSGPNTVSMLAELQDHYGNNWLRVVRLNENGGAGVARNAGWDRATQPYIAFLDADDSWHPRKTEVQLGWMEAHPDVAMTGLPSAVVVDVPTWTAADTAPADEAPVARRVTRRKQFVSNKFATSSVSMRTALPHRFQPERRYAEDNLLWLRVILDGLPVYRMGGDPLVFYHKSKFGAGGLSGNMSKMLEGQLDTCRRLLRESRITLPEMALLYGWQLAKHARRVAIVGWKERWGVTSNA